MDTQNEIEIRKKISKMFFEAKRNAKPQTCILCGRSQSSFCNSHSVPQMILKEIADNGMLLYATAVMKPKSGFEIVDTEGGINKSGTFNYICKDCDRTFFQDYENPDNIVIKPSDKVLAEIAVKNILLEMYKREVEIQSIQIQQKDSHTYFNPEKLLNIKNLDFREYVAELKFHKSIADNNETGGYKILFWDILPYRVPIAAQSAIALLKDMNGNMINDVYDLNESTRMQYAHIAIFPFKAQSVILAFYHKRDKLYRNLSHQFNSSSKEKILQFLNYIIFAYTENYFISKSIKQEIETNENLCKLSQEINFLPGMGMLGPYNSFGIGYKPVPPEDIPNFLLPEWAV